MYPQYPKFKIVLTGLDGQPAKEIDVPALVIGSMMLGLDLVQKEPTLETDSVTSYLEETREAIRETLAGEYTQLLDDLPKARRDHVVREADDAHLVTDNLRFIVKLATAAVESPTATAHQKQTAHLILTDIAITGFTEYVGYLLNQPERIRSLFTRSVIRSLQERDPWPPSA